MVQGQTRASRMVWRLKGVIHLYTEICIYQKWHFKYWEKLDYPYEVLKHLAFYLEKTKLDFYFTT